MSLLGDGLRTLVVLLAIIAVLAGAQQVLSRPQTAPVRPVEYVSAAASARSVAPFDVLAPARLPPGWRATSVRYEPGEEATWHVGVLTDDDKYVGLEQAVGGVDALVDTFAEAAEPAGTVELGGVRWQLLRDGDETTLVRDDDGAAVRVTGDAPQADVERLAKSLRS